MSLDNREKKEGSFPCLEESEFVAYPCLLVQDRVGDSMSVEYELNRGHVYLRCRYVLQVMSSTFIYREFPNYALDGRGICLQVDGGASAA